MSEAEFLNWARAHALPLPQPLTTNGPLNRWLADALVGKNLVFLGEPDHFIAEKQDYRQTFISSLWSLGVRNVAEELSFSDGYRINKWLHSGDADAPLELATFGATPDARSDRDDSPTGVLKASFAQGPHPGFVRQARETLKHLQQLYVEDQQASYFGFDVDYSPGGGYQDLLEVAPQTLQADPDWSAFLSRLERTEHESLDDEINRLQQLHAWLRSKLETSSHWRRVARHLKALLDGYCYVALANPAGNYEALAPAMARRESVMHAQLSSHLQQLPKQAKTVVLGHNLHLARRDDLIDSATGVNPGGDRVDSLGHFLNATYPDEILSIWMIQGGGEDSQPLAGLPRRLEAPENSFNRLLARVGDAFLLPTGGSSPGHRYLARQQSIYHMYNAHFVTAPASQTDAIVFLRQVTPS